MTEAIAKLIGGALGVFVACAAVGFGLACGAALALRMLGLV